MTQIQLIAEAGVDFLEISGGTYEDPTVCIYGILLLPSVSYLPLSFQHACIHNRLQHTLYGRSADNAEHIQMMGRGLRDEPSDPRSRNKANHEAFFLDFATRARTRFPNLILLLTGGFRTRKGIEAALKDGVCDLVGIGRPAVLRPDFPRFVMDDMYSDQEARVVFPKVPIPFLAKLLKIRMLGGGAETVGYILNISCFPCIALTDSPSDTSVSKFTA
jgi:hypothetical protein